MAAFERKTIPFPTRGQNWNMPADKVPPEQAPFMRNVRMSQEGEITARPGLSLFAALGVVPIHSITNLNNSHESQAWSYEFILGQGSEVITGRDSTFFGNANSNPVYLPFYQVAGAWKHVGISGYPLSFVDMQPIGSPYSFKYVGDHSQMFSLGVYPGDQPDYDGAPMAGFPSMMRANYMGLPIPVNNVVPGAVGSPGGTGNLSGAYQWAFAYRNKFTGARSNLSAPTRTGPPLSPWLTLDDQGASFTLPNAPYDPQQADPIPPLPPTNLDPNIVIDVYRFGGTLTRWVFVGTGNSGDTFIDDFSDAVLSTSPSPPSITDPVTGVTRFTNFMPFVSQDRAYFGEATLSQTATGSWILTFLPLSSGDHFNTRWFNGSYIGVNQGNFSIYQVISDTVLELTEDASGAVPTPSTDPVPWSTPEGTLKYGTPLPHIWGPFSTGTGGAYVFGVGNPEEPGVLYWTNGNDPDSTDVVNTLIVTGPSEPLINGCIVDGTNILWSTERMWRVYPSLTVAGQFTVEELPGGKGILAPYSLTTQTNGTSEHVTWVGRDGVYNWSIAAGLECLTDPAMYPFMIHDNTPARTLQEIFPWLTDEGTVSGIDFSDVMLRYHRLTWWDGMLFYDFPMTLIAPYPTPTYATLVYDSKQAKGWVSLDLHELHASGIGYINAGPICRSSPIGGYYYRTNNQAPSTQTDQLNVWNNLFVACRGDLYTYIGSTDNGRPINCRVITRAEDLGDPRSQKLWGDLILDANPNGNTISSQIRLNFETDTSLTANTITGSARDQQIVDFSSGLGVLSPTFALDLTWAGDSFIYQYQPAFVVKPEITHGRATDWSDDGEPGDKWAFGCLIEANTFGLPRQVEIHGDNDVIIDTLTVNHDGQSTKPYFFDVPVITHQMRCVPTDPSTWELFRFIPKWTKKPELTRFQTDWTDDGKPVPKYLQGFVLQADTEGNDVTVELWADQVLVQSFTVNHAGELEKPYPVTDPPTIHEMKLIPSVSGDDIRFAENWKVGWVYVQQPEFTQWVPDYTPSDPTAYHGVAIEADTQGNTVSVDVVSEGAVVRTLSVNHDGRVQKCYSFLQPFISTEIKLVPHGDWRQYPDWKVRWVGYPKPDLAALYTDWDDDGYQGAKFFQGFVLHADTAGLDTNFTVEYDGGTIAQVFSAVNHPTEREIAYSFITPFIAHQVRAYPDIPIRFTQPWKIRWIWEPAPELAKRWITQTTAHMLQGWFHHRDCYIALQSYDFVTLRITDDLGTVNSYVFASTGGFVRKPYEVLLPQKAKLVSYALTSCLPFRLFQKDCEVRIAQWKRGAEQEYTIARPFGGPHYERGAFI